MKYLKKMKSLQTLGLQRLNPELSFLKSLEICLVFSVLQAFSLKISVFRLLVLLRNIRKTSNDKKRRT